MEHDEECVPHAFNSRTRYEPGDDRDIWCKDCEYHRDHDIHSQRLAWRREQFQERYPIPAEVWKGKTTAEQLAFDAGWRYCRSQMRAERKPTTGGQHMEVVIIPAATVVHINGVPVALAVDTLVETVAENMPLLTGYHYAHRPESPAPPTTNRGAEQSDENHHD